jgi:hypothetical protein
MCYHFHVGASLLMAVFDGMAVRNVEKKVSVRNLLGCCLLARREDLPIHASGATRHRAADATTHQGRTTLARSLRNFSKALPAAWLSPQMLLAAVFGDLRFPIDSCNKSAPVYEGLSRTTVQ